MPQTNSLCRDEFQCQLIQSSITNPHLLWNNIHSLLHHNRTTTLPSTTPKSSLAKSFATFFRIKYLVFVSYSPQTLHPLHSNLTLLTISQSSHLSLLQVLMKFPKSFISPNKKCDHDPIPTFLLKQVSSTILPIITTIVNLSLTNGTFPTKLSNRLLHRS